MKEGAFTQYKQQLQVALPVSLRFL